MNLLQKGVHWLAGKLTAGMKHVTSSFYPQRLSGASFAGKDVNVDIALTLSAVWACVNRIAGTISTMPIQIFERLPNGGRRSVDYDHPLYQILHDTPNADMTAIEFWQAMQSSVELWGNAYAAKQTSMNHIIGLDLLRPEHMTVRRLPDGSIEYRYSDRGGVKVYKETEILHIKGMTLDGLKGMSPIAYMRNSIGLAIALEESAGELFKNGMRPGGILNVPHRLKGGQREELYQEIDDFKQSRNGGILVTELGEMFTPILVNPEDAQLLASRNWSVEEICRWFGVPPYLAGYTEKSTSWGTGMEQQNSAYLVYTILPRIRKIEQSIEKSLIPIEERRRYYIRFNYEGLLRADSKTRAEVHALNVRNGIQSRNEARQKENLDPYDGGDVYTIEANLTTVERVIKGETGLAQITQPTGRK